MKSKNGLLDRQSAFLRELMRARVTVARVIRRQKISASMFRRWMQSPAFVTHWGLVNQYLGLRCGTDTACLGILEAEFGQRAVRGHARTSEAPPTAAADATAPAGHAEPVAPVHAIAAERERIRAVNGERAAESFDELVRLRRAREAAAAAAAGSGVAS